MRKQGPEQYCDLLKVTQLGGTEWEKTRISVWRKAQHIFACYTSTTKSKMYELISSGSNIIVRRQEINDLQPLGSMGKKLKALLMFRKKYKTGPGEQGGFVGSHHASFSLNPQNPT